MKKIVFALVLIAFAFACKTKKELIYKTLPPADYSFDARFIKVNDSLYASKTFITNGEYRAFLYNLLDKGDTAGYNDCIPKEYRRKLEPCGPYRGMQWAHPVYRDSAIVYIRYADAAAYCNWLTKGHDTLATCEYKSLVFKVAAADSLTWDIEGPFTVLADVVER